MPRWHRRDQIAVEVYSPPPQDRIPVQVEHLQLATFHQSGVHINIASSRQAMSDSKSFLAHTECGASSQIYLKFNRFVW